MLRIVLIVALGTALVPAPASAAKPVAGARYADTDYAFWADLRVSRSGGWLNPRLSTVANGSDWTCPGLDFHLGTPRRPVRIARSGRFRYVRTRGRFTLTVSGRFRNRDTAVISFRYRREPRRRGRQCDDSRRIALLPKRLRPLEVGDCRTHPAKTLLATPAGRVFLHSAWDDRDGWTSVAYGCLFSVNEPFELAQDGDDDSDVDRLRLTDPYLAYEHSECPMGCWFSIHVQDLRDGTVRHLPRAEAFGQVTDLELKDNGSVAWIARPYQYSMDRTPVVWADDSSGTRRLDAGDILLDSLELNGSTVSWIRDGAPMSATLD